jgi:hypothetical protein
LMMLHCGVEPVRACGDHRRRLAMDIDGDIADDHPCDLCGGVDSPKGNRMVFCDGRRCTVAVHQLCYGIPRVPKGSWMCHNCGGDAPDAATIRRVRLPAAAAVECVVAVSSLCRRCVVAVSSLCRRCVVAVSSLCRRCDAVCVPRGGAVVHAGQGARVACWVVCSCRAACPRQA